MLSLITSEKIPQENTYQNYSIYLKCIVSTELGLKNSSLIASWPRNVSTKLFLTPCLTFPIFKPKKDQCCQCTSYRQADSKTQETLQEQYDKHKKNKERGRQIKKEEKESADPSETTVALPFGKGFEHYAIWGRILSL